MHIEYLKNTSEGITAPFHLLSSENLSYSSSGYVMYNYNFNAGVYVFMSPAIEVLTGYSIAELNIAGFKSIVKKVFSNKMDRYKINNGTDLSIEEFYAKYLIETKTGERKWIEDNSFTYLDKKGRRLNSIGILRDTSFLQKLIDSTNEEKNNLDKIFDLSDTMLIQVDKDLNIIMINKKGCRILGGEKSNILGRNIKEFISDEFKPGFEKYVNKLINEAGLSTKSSQGKIKALDNKSKFIEWHNALIRDEDGAVVSIIASGQEITQRKKEEKIRLVISEILDEANSAKKLGDLFKSIHRSISKLMKAENFYIAYYSSEQNLLSFPYFVDKYDNDDSPQPLGKGLTEYVLRTGKSALVDSKLDEELRVKGETQLIGPQSKIWLGVPLKIQNKIIGVLVVQDYEDPTTYGATEQQILDVIAYPISRAIERKMLEAEREDFIVKLKELNSSKDQLFSLISHDLRNPFNSLLGFAEILTTEYDSLTKDEIREYVKVINESAKNLFGMTNNLLHYSRYQLGKYQYKPININVYEIIQSIVGTQKGNIKKKDLLVVNNIDKNSFVYADQDLLYIALFNIIENSIKYSVPGKRIVMNDESYDKKNINENMLRILVKDEGIGISEENLKKIERKEMFSTNGTQREFGTGLGLLISRDFLKINKGSLYLESEIGKGTVVSILLPSADSKN
jgi:PAS domain S-box-containing protein